MATRNQGRPDLQVTRVRLGRLALFGVLGLCAVAILAISMLALWLQGQAQVGAASGLSLAEFAHGSLGTGLGAIIGTLTLSAATLVALIVLITRAQDMQAKILIESRERNRAIVDNMVDGAFHVDAEGRLVALNAAAERIFGYASPEVRHAPMSILFPPPFQADFEARIERLKATHAPLTLEDPGNLSGRRKDGSVFPLYLAISEVHVGGYPMFTAIARDMTEAHRQMAELEQARDAALAADRAKSQFLAVMSHEIRTPMNGILGMLDLLRDGKLTQQQQEFIDTAADSGNILLNIINDILDLSKIEAGKLDLQALDFDLRNTVEDITALMASNARDKSLEVASFFHPNVPSMVRGDPYRLRQILMNLMGNAVKFTARGEILVSVSAQAIGESETLLRFDVKDSGIGVSPQVRQTLFRPFTQADASTTRRFGGTGLGLVISKRLAELMGGEIGVESEPGVGSTFWFTIRLGSVEEAQTDYGRDLSGVKALIVDDNSINRLILENYLAHWGVRAHSVDGGAAALAALQSALEEGDPFELAILDMQMPGMDGIELAQRIKGDEALSATKLLMLSSLGYPGRDARRAGIEVSLLKPVREALLHDAAAKVLGRAPQTAGIVVPAAEPGPRFDASILVAEDNPVNWQVVALMLKRFGIKADLAKNGEEAIHAYETHRYDMVFMDLQMPVMGGDEATRRIRAIENGGRRTPIIAMTAAALKTDQDACRAAGMDDFVSKPVRKQELEAVIQRWLPPRADS